MIPCHALCIPGSPVSFGIVESGGPGNKATFSSLEAYVNSEGSLDLLFRYVYKN